MKIWSRLGFLLEKRNRLVIQMNNISLTIAKSSSLSILGGVYANEHLYIPFEVISDRISEKCGCVILWQTLFIIDLGAQNEFLHDQFLHQ
ncbi:hypothetical protein FGO68_gene16599 [Halteria grandinella]|uniref:Uncharacterized protein n=1 Tax=Halteria grandinella TaxID=5974 RepID=A0A8J8NM50_HALGN|nr:hypothetical protein FGO68_gene16599 [Halteria grandinella]